MCVNGPPETVNVKGEANIFLQAIAAYHVSIVKFARFHHFVNQ